MKKLNIHWKPNFKLKKKYSIENPLVLGKKNMDFQYEKIFNEKPNIPMLKIWMLTEKHKCSMKKSNC